MAQCHHRVSRQGKHAIRLLFNATDRGGGGVPSMSGKRSISDRRASSNAVSHLLLDYTHELVEFLRFFLKINEVNSPSGSACGAFRTGLLRVPPALRPFLSTDFQCLASL